MDEKLLVGLIGIAAGAVGYFFTTFWMKPILRYGELRQSVLSDLIFFADVVNAEGLNDGMKKKLLSRTEANRRHAADLIACALDLPLAYRWILSLRGHSIDDAAKNLIGFSNTFEYEAAEKRVARIKKNLGIKTDLV